MAIQVSDMQLGSTIAVKSVFGKGPIVYGTVRKIEKLDDEQVVVDYENGQTTFWCYLHQIVEVIQY